MREADFRDRLAALIQRHPCETYDRAVLKAWDSEFEDLLYETTADQSRRALMLYQLHMENHAIIRASARGRQ